MTVNEYCTHCDDFSECEVREAVEKVEVKGKFVTMTRHRAYCKACGNEVWSDELATKDQEVAFALREENE